MAPNGDSDLWVLLPKPVRQLPADLAAVVILTAVTIGVVFLPVINETPLRVVVGLPFVLFLPGYVFIAALFPEAGDAPTADAQHEDEPQPRTIGSRTVPPEADRGPEEHTPEDDGDSEEGVDSWRDRSGIDGIERVALSFGLSIAIVPLLGLVLNFTPWGIRLVPIVVAVAGFTLLMVAIAAQRRWALPPEERFRVPYREWIAAGKREVFEPEDRTDAALNVALAASILLAVGAVGYAIAVPPQGEQFSEFYVLTEDDDGELVAANYPESFVVGDSEPIVVGIGNQEYETVEYTVVIEAHDTELIDDGNETRVLDRERLETRTVTLAHNETRHLDVDLEPTLIGEDIRVTFFLYLGDESVVPADPDPEEAYRSLHLWADVYETEADRDAAEEESI